MNRTLKRNAAAAVLLASVTFGPAAVSPAPAVSAPAPQVAAAAATAPESGALSWAQGQLGQAIDDGLCLRFVVDAYSQGGGIDIGTANSAIDYWNAHADRQHAGDTNPPVGALVFWDAEASNPDGHVGIAEGGDTVISTTERSSSGVHEFSIADRNATKPYLGWLLPD